MNEPSPSAGVWQRPEVAHGFLDERSLALPFRTEQIDVLLRLLRHADTSIRRVLDLGCGDGVLLAAVLTAFPDAGGVGLDFSEPMLTRAADRLGGFGRRVELADGDLGAPGWQQGLSGSFDSIISGFAIHHLSDERKRALYAEIYARLEPGGVFVNCEHVASPTPEIEALFDEANAEHLLRQRRARGEDVTFEQVHHEYLTRPDRAANILAPLEAQLAWLREIGYVQVDCFWKWFELAIFGGYKRRQSA
jgi:SAM-dependent methyltransferase